MPDLVTRPSDNDPDLRLQVMQDEQGDVYVSIRGGKRNPLGDAVRFCTMAGGGRSPRTRNAIQELMRAMRDDQKEYP